MLKAKDIVVGGHYIAKVGANVTTVRVDAIRKVEGSTYRKGFTAYDVTNLKTNRQVTFRSAMKFRHRLVGTPQIRHDPAKPKLTDLKPAYQCSCGKSYGFLIPAICECGKPVPTLEGTVPFDIEAYQQFAAQMDAEGGPQALLGRLQLSDAPLVKHELVSRLERSDSDRAVVAKMMEPTSESPTVHVEFKRLTNMDTVPEGEQCSDPTPVGLGTGSTTAPTGTNGLAGRLAAQMATPDAPHVQLKALAGTGKTTSCIEGLKVVKGIGASVTPSPQQKAFWDQLCLGKSDTVRLSSFSTGITDELKSRLSSSGLDKRGCEARGIHSLGLQAVTKAFGRLQATGWTTKDLICQVLGKDFHDIKREKGMLTLVNATDDLVSLCKQNLVEPNAENLDRLISHYDVEVDSHRARIGELVPQVLERCKSPSGRIHFDDMVWLPLVLDLPISKTDVQIVDEAQDLNRMQQELVYRGGHRVVFVGDEHQAIYGFAGADSESMARMSITLGASARGIAQLPLTVTRRCGKAIVREAQRMVPEYEAHESNCEGLVDEARYPTKKDQTTGKMVELPWEETYCPLVRDGAMILCRVNAPLVSQCFRFLKRKIKANILGRKIGEGLVTLVDKSKQMTTSDFKGWLHDWVQKELDAENKKKFSSEARLIAIQDKADCIDCFAEDTTTTGEIIAKIKSVFTDSKDIAGVRLASIHKSKGLEADQVFFLQPKGGECPHSMARSAWQREQENNLEYVATTRAIKELYIVR